jgi:hypothetical protein
MSFATKHPWWTFFGVLFGLSAVSSGAARIGESVAAKKAGQ